MRPTYGLLLAIFTALCFGTLPLILKVLVRTIDPWTLTWSRFILAAIALSLLRIVRPGKTRTGPVTRGSLLIAGLAGLGITTNYVLYQSGIHFTTPDTAQIVIQISPMFLLAGGILIYREAFGRPQWIGLVILVAGMALFFRGSGSEVLAARTDYARGIWMIVAAGAAWAVFALAQKTVVPIFGAIDTMRACYAIGTVLLLPTVSFALLLTLDLLNVGLLFLSVLLTVASYVAFSESLRHLEASRVSLVLANVPLLTLCASRLADLLFPGVIPTDDLGFTGAAGALLVVGGSALGNLRPRGKK